MVLKKVMITGVSGIVGSSAYLLMRQSPDRYDLYGLGRRRALSDRVKDVRQIDLPAEKHRVADIADFESVRQAVEGMHTVVHLAADPAGGEWESVLRNNIIGGIIQACVDAPDELRFDIFYGMSNNRYGWVDMTNARDKLGFVPQDRAEDRLPQQ